MPLLAADGPSDLVVHEKLAEGSVVAICGSSGAGKTTLLRILAGLTRPGHGRIEIGDEVWLDTRRGYELPPQRRPIGYVFQDYALMPNMTVRGNVAFGAGRGAGDLVDELLHLTGLDELRDRRPATLSGGQRQRVALARALARRPRLLLLDEPLSAVDATLRRRLQDELAALHTRFGVTTILVSHDIGEVFRLADTAIVLEAGAVVRRGTPREVFLGGGSSGRIVLSAQVLAVRPADIAYVVSLLVGTDVIDVVATADDIAGLAPGDAVAVAPKAFSPFVWKTRRRP